MRLWMILKNTCNEIFTRHAYTPLVLDGDKELPTHLKKEIEDVRNDCFISIASLWEIAIKYSLGKLNLQFPFPILVII